MKNIPTKPVSEKHAKLSNFRPIRSEMQGKKGGFSVHLSSFTNVAEVTFIISHAELAGGSLVYYLPGQYKYSEPLSFPLENL